MVSNIKESLRAAGSRARSVIAPGIGKISTELAKMAIENPEFITALAVGLAQASQIPDEERDYVSPTDLLNTNLALAAGANLARKDSFVRGLFEMGRSIFQSWLYSGVNARQPHTRLPKIHQLTHHNRND